LQTKFTPGAVNQSSVAKIENFRALVGWHLFCPLIDLAQEPHFDHLSFAAGTTNSPSLIN
jgi:hypothetical protein